MKIESLISTMNLKNPIELVERMNLQTDAVIINQCDEEYEDVVQWNGKQIRIYSYKERGLSKSRNRAVEHIGKDVDVVHIADDNFFYQSDFQKNVEQGYKENPKADLVCFSVLNNSRGVQIIPKKLPKSVGKIASFRAYSVRITIKVSSLQKNKIRFDERFGTGSRYFMGEENIFTSDCLKKKMKINGINIFIGEKMAIRKSTWYKGMNQEYFLVRGAVLKRMFPCAYPVFILDFAVRKRKKYKEQVTFTEAISYMRQGAKEFKKEEIMSGK